MAQLVTGTAPLSYQGVQASTPPQFFTNYNRAPGINDTNFPLGTMWLYINKSAPTYQLFMLVSVANPYATGIATWSMLFPAAGSGINTINTNAGSLTGFATISLLGTVNQTTTSAAGSTINIGLPNDIIAPGSLEVTNGLLVDAGGTVITSGGLNVVAGGLNATGTIAFPSNSWGALVSNAGGIVTSENPNIAGYVLTSNGVAALPTFQPAGGGGGGIVTLDADAGSATGNPVTLAGGTGLSTTAAGATVTFNLDIPVSIAHGGTNATAMATTDGVVYYDGTRLVTTSAGLATEVLTSNGPGMAPTFQPAGGGGSGNAFLYTISSPSNVLGNTASYTLGTSGTTTKIFDNGGTQFTGTAFTASATGVWQFTTNINITGTTAYNSFPVFVAIVVTDAITPANTITYVSPFTYQQVANVPIPPIQFTVNCKMSAGATANFIVYALTGSGVNQLAVQAVAAGGYFSYTTISGYQISS